MIEKKWFHTDNANEIDSPALLVYPERVKTNIQTAVKMIGDVNNLRLHIKTHKCASPWFVSVNNKYAPMCVSTHQNLKIKQAVLMKESDV